MNSKIVYVLSILTISLSACGAFPTTNDLLDGTSWELVAIGEQPPLEGTTITLYFEDGQVRGSSGCNLFGGAYQVSGNEIEFQEFESTVMACPEPSGVMDQETAYLETLGEAQRFEFVDSQLQIFGSEGESLTFVPIG